MSRIGNPQEDKGHLEIVDPALQLIAEALDAVQSDNRAGDFDVKVMAGITMNAVPKWHFSKSVGSYHLIVVTIILTALNRVFTSRLGVE